MDQTETAPHSLSWKNGGSSSSKETDDDYLWDQRTVFMFQPDIKVNAKEDEPQPELDLELRLCTMPSHNNVNSPVASPFTKKKMSPKDEASCCWETSGGLLLMNLDHKVCNTVASSHSSTASS